MIHEQVDMPRWRQEFPLAGLWDEVRARYHQFAEKDERYASAEDYLKKFIDRADFGEITGPRNLAHIEQYRDEKLTPEERRQGIPTDVFVWNLGEAPRREMTKIGGLPYWPRAQKWPCNKKGVPLVFAGQLCFADSRDLVPETPGDILLLFCELYEPLPGESASENFDVSTLRTFWADISDAPLVSASDVAASNDFLLPLYGSIHRTMDYPKAKCLFAKLDAKEFAKLGLDLSEIPDSSPWKLNRLEGTKIGGDPHWIQNPERVGGRFIAAFGSLPYLWSSDESYTFLNVKTPCNEWENDKELKRHAGKSPLCWDDCGVHYFFLKRHPLTRQYRMSSTFQCY